ncbi:hypothetical protein JHK87_047573 [Glycine soja]|nr:hypothetical protein JHK87_047573 [Glycine soja]
MMISQVNLGEEKEESSKSKEVLLKEKEFEDFHDFDTLFGKEVLSIEKKDEGHHEPEASPRKKHTSSARKKHLRNVRSVNLVAMQNKVDMPDITFTSANFKGLDLEQNNPMVITIQVAGFLVKKTLRDHRSSKNILFQNTFTQLDILESTLYPRMTPSSDFPGEESSPGVP